MYVSSLYLHCYFETYNTQPVAYDTQGLYIDHATNWLTDICFCLVAVVTSESLLLRSFLLQDNSHIQYIILAVEGLA